MHFCFGSHAVYLDHISRSYLERAQGATKYTTIYIYSTEKKDTHYCVVCCEAVTVMKTPCCERMGLKKGPWTVEEDQILVSHIQRYGHGNWRALPKQAGNYKFF